MTKFSSMNLSQYSAKEALSHDIPNIGSPPLKIKRTKRLWGDVRSLTSLQPYANPRSSYPARLLNATLVIPEIQRSTRSKGVSYKFKSFTYLYDEEEFIISLKNDVNIVKTLPKYLKPAGKRSEFPIVKPQNSASPNFYVKEVLPKLKKAKVVGLIITDGGCLQSILPTSMYEFQRLRCRVAFHALQFWPEIQILGLRMVERYNFHLPLPVNGSNAMLYQDIFSLLQASGQPFLAYHLGLIRDTLAYHGCAELYQDVHTELIQYRRAQLIKQGIINDELSVDSHMQRENGSCPLMPEEVRYKYISLLQTRIVLSWCFLCTIP
ncbi:hypothetical protein V6N12_015495 [Hibiscus sabdariffa]|uniref:O-fucosyltransferase family protein n=1 Tax=Hibiscus sabdariffa TaxID=183260 RepID=A0ABR2DNR7_9ROSI